MERVEKLAAIESLSLLRKSTVLQNAQLRARYIPWAYRTQIHID